MLVEYRRYQASPGKLALLNERFEKVVLPLFARHGMRVVGFWQPIVGATDEVHYLLAWEDMGEMQRCWAAFVADPEWQRASAEYDADGALLARGVNEVWSPTSYSPKLGVTP